MWRSSPQGKATKAAAMRRPSVVRQVAEQCPSLQEPSSPPCRGFSQESDFVKCIFQIFLTVFLRQVGKKVWKHWRNTKRLTVLFSSGFPWLFLRQLSLESAGVTNTIPASLRPRSIYTPIAALLLHRMNCSNIKPKSCSCCSNRPVSYFHQLIILSPSENDAIGLHCNLVCTQESDFLNCISQILKTHFSNPGNCISQSVLKSAFLVWSAAGRE